MQGAGIAQDARRGARGVARGPVLRGRLRRAVHQLLPDDQAGRARALPRRGQRLGAEGIFRAVLRCRSLDGAQRNPGPAPTDRSVPDYASLRPGYNQTNTLGKTARMTMHAAPDVEAVTPSP